MPEFTVVIYTKVSSLNEEVALTYAMQHYARSVGLDGRIALKHGSIVLRDWSPLHGHRINYGRSARAKRKQLSDGA